MASAEDQGSAQTAAPREQSAAAWGQPSRGSGHPFLCCFQSLLQLTTLIGKPLPLTYMEKVNKKNVIRNLHALKGAGISFFTGRVGRESPEEQQWQR